MSSFQYLKKLIEIKDFNRIIELGKILDEKFEGSLELLIFFIDND